MTTIRIGSRKSQLAMWQTETVAAMLQQAGIATEIVTMDTIGDRILDTTIAKIGSKGVFTEELEEQLTSGVTDIAVHSAKDMPSRLADGFELIAFSAREQAGDVLVSHRRDLDISDSSRPLTVGTSSVRRVALLRHYYPHVHCVNMRGNLQTRIRKLKEGVCDALLLAFAGVHRMGYGDMIIHRFSEEVFVPPVGQGCIAVEAARSLSPDKRQLVRDCVNNPQAELCLKAERAFLKRLEGGCSIPAFALACLDGADTLTLRGGLISLDGGQLLQRTMSAPAGQAEAAGDQLAREILANGGQKLLARIRQEQAQAAG